jgi:bifunctional non-homologous end joining protein LigD
MPQIAFQPCLPTPSKQVPSGPDWLHEIKHDGYRMIVQREGKRVRLFTRNSHDWTDRYPNTGQTKTNPFGPQSADKSA